MAIRREPNVWITNGYDIHVVFQPAELDKASALFRSFTDYLSRHRIAVERALLFEEPVGPWPCPMWQVLLPQHQEMHAQLGLCISWLMLNRGSFSVMIHPNTRQDEQRGGPYEDHSANLLWLGEGLPLKLDML